MKQLLRKAIPEGLQPENIAMQRVIKWADGEVKSGPFTGMKYVPESIGSALAPKLLGTYEQDLAPILTEIKNLKPGLLVDIGAAEGYYAVGILFANIAPRVIAYEMEETGRKLVAKLAERNGIGTDRLRIEGECTPENLTAALADYRKGGETRPVVLIVDVEGFEGVLLDPEKLPALRDTPILVEMHDFLKEGLTELLQKRFAATHTIRRINETQRTQDDVVCDDWVFRALPPRFRANVVYECRPVTMHWLWMTPKGAA